MTSITARNALSTEGTVTELLKAAPKAAGGGARKAVAKGKDAVAEGKDQPVKAAPAKPEPVACNCGCGEMANLGRAYKPGHDARHAGQVGRMLAEGNDGAQAAFDALPAKLQEKASRFAANRAKEAATKDAKAAIKAEMAAELTRRLAAL